MIMAGGSGTRLWPMSRHNRPKQLLPFIGGQSLLDIAAARLDGIVPAERRLICTGERFRSAIHESLPEFTDDRILGEPVGRDTVNAVGFTAAVLARQDPEAVFAVLTADHIIEPQTEFARRLDLGFSLVEDDPSRFVTFSIVPTYPATGYGYVERGDPIDGFERAFIARQFVEKPDVDRARSYLDAGTFGWNSGMFVFSASAFMDALSRFLPESFEGLSRIADAWGTADQQQVLGETYPNLPRKSVDYAVMEPASDGDEFTVCAVPMDVQWMDVGSWPTYGETLDPDGDGNRANTPLLSIDSRRVLAVSDVPDHLIAAVDCQDLIIIHTADVTLVCPSSSAQRVKELVAQADEIYK
jgi:mannose-1-phosphate guanylyltransferase